MRRVREILRLKHECGASDRMIGRSLAAADRVRPFAADWRELELAPVGAGAAQRAAAGHR